MELNEFFKSYVDTEEDPVFICDKDMHIIYLNSVAASKYSEYGGYNIIGKHLDVFLDIETKSKTDMIIEWFKESKENNSVFAFRYENVNMDVYVTALRNDKGEFIGFCNKCRSRVPDTNDPYNID